MRYKLLILLCIMGCSLAPDDPFGSDYYILDRLFSDFLTLVLDFCVIYDRIVYEFIHITFIICFHVLTELSTTVVDFITCFVDFITCDFMISVYQFLACFLNNMSTFSNKHHIWILFFSFELHFRHTKYCSVEAVYCFRRVANTPPPVVSVPLLILLLLPMTAPWDCVLYTLGTTLLALIFLLNEILRTSIYVLSLLSFQFRNILNLYLYLYYLQVTCF